MADPRSCKSVLSSHATISYKILFTELDLKIQLHYSTERDSHWRMTALLNLKVKLNLMMTVIIKCESLRNRMGQVQRTSRFSSRSDIYTLAGAEEEDEEYQSKG